MRWLRRLGLAVVGLPLFYLLAGFAGALWPAPPISLSPDAPAIRIGLIAGPIHTDLLLPLDAPTRDRLAFAGAAGVPLDAPGAEWAVVGWGSRGFYTATGGYRDLALATVWTAATGDSAVLRIDAAGSVAHVAGIRWLDLTRGQYAALLNAVLRDVAPDPVPDAGLTRTDAFFAAPGRFDIWRTCNSWLGARLAEAGVPIGRWTPTIWSLRLSLRIWAAPS